MVPRDGSAGDEGTRGAGSRDPASRRCSLPASTRPAAGEKSRTHGGGAGWGRRKRGGGEEGGRSGGPAGRRWVPVPSGEGERRLPSRGEPVGRGWRPSRSRLPGCGLRGAALPPALPLSGCGLCRHAGGAGGGRPGLLGAGGVSPGNCVLWLLTRSLRSPPTSRLCASKETRRLRFSTEKQDLVFSVRGFRLARAVPGAVPVCTCLSVSKFNGNYH